jgi:16S rRNA (cytosine967-C5)-methyltransferase
MLPETPTPALTRHAHSQARTFLALFNELLPHLRADRNLPARIQRRLAREHRFGSRDRRLYRELFYTAIRHLPWFENALVSLKNFTPAAASPAASPFHALLWLAADSPATLPLKRALLPAAPPAPPAPTERAVFLGLDATGLLPAWFRGHCPEAFAPPNLDALNTRAPLWLRLQTDAPAPVLAEFDALGWPHRASPELAGALELLVPDADITKTDAYQRGLVEIQDLGSQLILPIALAVIAGAGAGAGTGENPKFQIPNPKKIPNSEIPNFKTIATGTATGNVVGIGKTTGIGNAADAVEPATCNPHSAIRNALDACAGAGGKTLQLARLLGPAAQIDAADPRSDALAELARRAARARLKNIRVLPPSQPPAALYDAILVDAPCSGTGTWRRAPHLKWTTTEAGIRAAARLQFEILARHAPRVRPGGGFLIYATCSLSRHENEAVAARFLAAHPAFRLLHSETLLPAARNTDGFHVAVFRKPASPAVEV